MAIWGNNEAFYCWDQVLNRNQCRVYPRGICNDAYTPQIAVIRPCLLQTSDMWEIQGKLLCREKLAFLGYLAYYRLGHVHHILWSTDPSKVFSVLLEVKNK